MVSIPIPSDVPGLDRATKDIAGALREMRDVSCGVGKGTVYIIAIAKPTNAALKRIPVPYAEIEGRVNKVALRSVKADSKGIAYACFSIIGTWTIDFRIRKTGIDFGKGISEWSEWKSPRVPSLTSPFTSVVVVTGTVQIPCPSWGITILSSKFDRLDERPNLKTMPLRVNYEGYGAEDVGGNFKIFIGSEGNWVQVGSGKAEPRSGIDYTIPTPLKDLSSIKDLLGKSVQVRVEIDHGGCIFSGTRTVSLPSLAVPCYGELGLNLDSIKDELSRFAKLPTSLNVPVFITNARGTIETTEIDVYVGNRLVGTTAAGRSIDLITVLKGRVSDLRKVNQIMLKPKSKCIKASTFDIPALIPTGIAPPALPCTVWETRANATMSQTKLQYPFSAYISGAKWVCRDTGKSIPIDGVDAEVFIGAMRFTIPIRSGAGSLALKAEEIKDIIAARAETIAPEIEAPERVTAECDKEGDVEGVAELQAWLSICFPGKGYRAVYDGGRWFKIIHRDGSHTRGLEYQDIKEDLRRNP